MNEIHYAANQDADFDPEVKVPQEKTGTEAQGEIGYAAAMEETECKICEGVGKVENYKGFMVPCQECSVDHDADAD